MLSRKEKILSVILGTIISFGLFIIPVATSQNNINSDSLLKLRNLQYEQAKRVIRMQDLKSEFDKLNSEQQQISTQINDWIKDQAKLQNVDLDKYRFDLDQLKFVPIEKK